jgi:hypothetical protein
MALAGHPEAMKMEPPRLFSHQCVEGEFSEVGFPLYGVLRSSHSRNSANFALTAFSEVAGMLTRAGSYEVMSSIH